MTARHAETCERARSLISRSVDCELPELQRTLLDTHVRRCVACAAFARDVGTITTALRSAPLEAPLRAVATPKRRRSVRLRVAVQAASIALVTIGVGTIVLPGDLGPNNRGDEGLLAGPLVEEQVAADSIRDLRAESLRHGDLAVLPEAGPESLGEAKPALPAIPET
jgi:predicted anti-sigma-YlaC factor YlaD